MKYNDYIKEFINYYKLDNFMFKVTPARCTGRTLFYKKILIFVLRSRFHLSFPKIAQLFNNNHTTILFHYNDIIDNPQLEDLVEDAMKFYIPGKEKVI